jgi:signal transduction histidine kinase
MMRFTTIRAQVTALVVLSILAAHLVFGVLIALSDRFVPANTSRLDHGPGLAAIAELYAAEPQARVAILQAASHAGIALHPIAPAAAESCISSHGLPPLIPMFLGVPHAGPPPGQVFQPCGPGGPPDLAGILPAGPGQWLGVDRPRSTPGGPAPLRHPWPLLALAITLGVPTLSVALFATRRVIAPLRNLAERADAIDADREQEILPVSGPAELVTLAESFNRLIARLRNHVSEQRRMIAGISHDLRTPLTRLRLRADSIADDTIRAKMLRDIEAMQILIDNSLALTSAQETALTRKPVELSALVQTIADEFADSGAGIAYGDMARVTVKCDAALLSRAIGNVIDNAIKFGGAAEIAVRRVGAEAEILITDHGPGLVGAEKEAVLTPFYRTDVSRGTTAGHGLGLAIARAVMQRHDGTIMFRDAAPKGLCAVLSLPSV